MDLGRLWTFMRVRFKDSLISLLISELRLVPLRESRRLMKRVRQREGIRRPS